jgi:hypothetical protein
MCPDKKLKWFNRNPDWRDADRAEVDRLVRTRWAETYKGAEDASVPMASASSAPPKKVVRRFADCILGCFTY